MIRNAFKFVLTAIGICSVSAAVGGSAAYFLGGGPVVAFIVGFAVGSALSPFATQYIA